MIREVLEIRKYLDEWKGEFYNIIKDAPAVHGYFLDEINNRRKGLAGPGYAVKLFGDLFERNVHKKGNFVESAVVFYIGIIDDLIDETETDKDRMVKILDDSGDFFINGSDVRYSSLSPIREYIKNNLQDESFQNLISDLKEMKFAAISELYAENYEDMKNSRIKIGSAHAKQLITIINSFSDSVLSENENEVIKNYCMGTTLLDSISDYCQDKYNNNDSFVSFRVKNGESLTSVLFSEMKDVESFISRANSFVPMHKKRDFNKIVNLAKGYYSISFAKKIFKYGFK